MTVRWIPLAVVGALAAALLIPGAAAIATNAAGSTGTTAADVTPPATCSPGVVNPTTNNVTDYHLDTNIVAPDRWSYQNLQSGDSPTLLVKGGSGAFAADEWAADLAKPEHAWYVKADGSIGTDDRPMAFVYSVGADQVGKTLELKGTFSSAGGRFRILQTKDGATDKTAGPYTSLFTYTGVSASFDIKVPVDAGDDLIFVSDQQTAWWVAGKLDATITTDNAEATAAVVASPGAGAVTTGTGVALTSPTAGACILYTTDGSNPLTSKTAATYSKPITITADTKLMTAAVAANHASSAVANLTYVLQEPFRSFSGVNQGDRAGLVGGAQWDRFDVDWNSIEPTKGNIDQAALAEYKRQITEARSNGITVLPMIGYTAGWAANRTGYSYDFHGQTFEYGPVTAETGDTLTRQLVTKDSSGKVLSTAIVHTSAGRTPPQNSADWQKYVTYIVGQLKPLGIDYFQVWNEAYPTSGFWTGGLDEYMQLIHLPAAAAIHAAGAKVVYGGWIAGAPISEYIALLDKYKAWNTIDVFDMHYMPVGAMDTIYKAAKQYGIAHPAVWQTEQGFTTQDKYIADVYPRAFYWALSKGGNDPNQFKMFYFAEWAPNDPAAFGYNRALFSGNDLSAKGKTLATLSGLLRGSTAKTYDSFTTSPALTPQINENLSSAEGFLLDSKRVVLAVHLKRQNDADIFEDWTTGDTLHLNFGDPMVKVTFNNVKNVTKLERVDLYGNRTPLKFTSLGNGRIETEVPVIDPNATVQALNNTENEVIFYVALQQG